MFRSATTLLSKVLNAHSKINIVSDPFFQFFKEYRNEMYSELDFDYGAPISDNFFSDYLDVNEKIKNSNFKVPFKRVGLNSVVESISPFCEFYCPELVPLLPGIKAENYDELFRKLLDLGKKVYGSEEIEFVGCKNTFCEQFISPMINTYPNIKVIQIVRDPRAILASQNKAAGGAYPILFVLRHWRKSIAYALENIDKKDNFLLVQYERFIENPEIETRIICSFLDIDYEGEMVNPKKYVSKEGKQWKQNSSFGTSTKITNKFSEKWKEILTKDQIKFVENLCYPEMKLFNYERFISPGDFTNLPEFNIEIQDWIKKYSSEFDIGPREMKKEEIRKYHLDKSEESKKVFIIDDFIYKLKNY